MKTLLIFCNIAFRISSGLVTGVPFLDDLAVPMDAHCTWGICFELVEMIWRLISVKALELTGKHHVHAEEGISLFSSFKLLVREVK